MRCTDDRLQAALRAAAPAVVTDGLHERLAQRRRARHLRRRVASGLLVVAVVAGSVAGFSALRRVFGTETRSGTNESAPSPLPEATVLKRLTGTARITTTVPFPEGSHGGGIAVGAGSAWVGFTDEQGAAGGVLRIDLATNDIVATIPVNEGPQRKRIVATDNAVWVGSTGLLQRIDPATNAVVASVDLSGRAVSAITADGLDVWAITIASSGGGMLVRVDQRTNEIVAETPLGVQITGYEDEVRVGGGSVWVVGVTWNQERDTEYGSDLIRIDPATNAVSARVPVGGFSLQVGAEDVWVRFPVDGAFDSGDDRWRWVMIDFATLEASPPFELDYVPRLITEHDVWTVDYDAQGNPRVSRYDLQTLELVSRSEPVRSPYTDSVIDPVSKTVWISALDGVVRLDIS